MDVHVGKRIRTRRLLLGMNQERLADALGLTFQQVQKYEAGANRVSASRLSATADILGVSISYFFGDLPTDNADISAEESLLRERMERPETIELVRLYYAISDPTVRHQFLELVKAVAHSAGLGRTPQPAVAPAPPAPTPKRRGRPRTALLSPATH
jgi:transcriptional regulator with XRE-family HTH domain